MSIVRIGRRYVEQGVERMYGEIRADEERDRVVVHLSEMELLLLAGCVNETLEAVEEREFSSRLGVPRTVAHELQADMRRLTAQLPHRR